MTDYRIVCRKRKLKIIDYLKLRDILPEIGSIINVDYYFAQRKLFNLFWVDCRFIDMSHNYDYSYDTDLEIVQNYVQKQLK